MPVVEGAQINSDTWNRIISGLPGNHILQTGQWGEFKSLYGWVPIYCIWSGGSIIRLTHSIPPINETIQAAALILKRSANLGKVALPFSVLYVPKGPLLKDWTDDVLRERVLDDLAGIAKENQSISIKIDPDVPLGFGEPNSAEDQEEPIGRLVQEDLLDKGWHYSDEQIQFRNSVWVDLSKPEDEILASMKQKTRYNIRLAVRKGVVVRKGTKDDIDTLYQMYLDTAIRDNFIIRDAGYYQNVWRLFIDSDLAQPLVALVDDQPVAGLILFHFFQNAWYFYGMSGAEHREKMPNYLLQWEAMRYAKSRGCLNYDFWGAPDHFVENDPMWGVYRFKEGFGGRVVRNLGAWDKPLQPAVYKFYTKIMPGVLDVMRKRNRQNRQQTFGN